MGQKPPLNTIAVYNFQKDSESTIASLFIILLSKKGYFDADSKQPDNTKM